MNNATLRVWIEGTIVAALAIVLSLLPTNIGPSLTLSLGMVPLTLYSLRRGMGAGFVAGFLWGVLHFLIGNAVILTFLQGLIEYFIAFSFAGVAGIVSSRIRFSTDKKRVWGWIVAASFLGTGARFFWHFIAGVIFWGSYAPEGVSPFVYSLITNGLSAIVTAVATALILVLIHASSPRMFLTK